MLNDCDDLVNGRYICECGKRTDNQNGICNQCQFIKDNSEMI